jgi:SAM-dependent methyltransferase
MTNILRIAAYLTVVFYGAAQSRIHDERFGNLAREAAELVLERLSAAGLDSGTVMDLGCGSGIYAAAIGAAGYDVVGCDLSADMIELARANAPDATIRHGSAHDADIPPAVAVTALGEVLNYAIDARAGIDAIAQLARRAHDALAPGGVFVFDIATHGRGTYAQFHVGDGWALGMHSRELGDTLERDISIFARNDDGSYQRFDEQHVLRLYDPGVVAQVVEAAGFAVEIREAYATPPTFSGWSVFVSVRR